MAGVAVKHLDRLIYAVLLSGRSNALGVRMILFAALAAIVGGPNAHGVRNEQTGKCLYNYSSVLTHV